MIFKALPSLEPLLGTAVSSSVVLNPRARGLCLLGLN